MDSNEPCPHCGPLQAEVERLRLEVESEREKQRQLVEKALVAYEHAIEAEHAQSELLDRIRELEQALAEANGRRCDNCKHGRIDRSYALSFDEPERIVFCSPLGSFQRGAWYCADFKPKPPEEGER